MSAHDIITKPRTPEIKQQLIDAGSQTRIPELKKLIQEHKNSQENEVL